MSNAERDWSDWLDYNKETIEKIPETSGVFMMHAAMKILNIGSSENLKKSVGDTLSDSCISKASRFRYWSTKSQEKIKEELIQEYRQKHEGELPQCMQE
jgi:hypothetical protein